MNDEQIQIAELALRFAPIVGGEREVGMFFLKLNRYRRNTGKLPSRSASRRMARQLFVQRIRTINHRRVDRHGRLSGVLFVSFDARHADSAGRELDLKEVLADPNGVDPRQSFDQARRARLVHELLAALKPDARALLQEYFFEHRRFREIGADRGVTARRAWHLVRAALAILQRRARVVGAEPSLWPRALRLAHELSAGRNRTLPVAA